MQAAPEHTEPGCSQVALPLQSMQQISRPGQRVVPQVRPPPSGFPPSVRHAFPEQIEPGAWQLPRPSQSMQQICPTSQRMSAQTTPCEVAWLPLQPSHPISARISALGRPMR
jgi:hypothetical protein